MKLEKGVTVYAGGKKFVEECPDEFAPKNPVKVEKEKPKKKDK